MRKAITNDEKSVQTQGVTLFHTRDEVEYEPTKQLVENKRLQVDCSAIDGPNPSSSQSGETLPNDARKQPKIFQSHVRKFRQKKVKQLIPTTPQD